MANENNYCVLNFKMYKSVQAIKAAGEEAARRSKNSGNIDESRTHLNSVVCGNGDYYKTFADAFEECDYYKEIDKYGRMHKIRDDTVLAVGVVMTTSHEAMDRIVENGQYEEWKKANIDFLMKIFGDDSEMNNENSNKMCIFEHLDERTIHLQGLITITALDKKGRRKLNKSAFIKSKQHLREIQDSFFTDIIQPNERKRTLRAITAKYEADTACVNSCHPMRVPFSFNCKMNNTPAKTKLFTITQRPYLWSDALDIASSIPDRCVTEYWNKTKKETTIKRNITIRTNKINELKQKEAEGTITEKEKEYLDLLIKLAEEGNLDISGDELRQMRNKGKRTKATRVHPITNDSDKNCNDDMDRVVDASKWDFVVIQAHGAGAVPYNVMAELGNLLKMRNGYHNHRRAFVIIYSAYALRVMSEEECERAIRIFIPDGFWETAVDIVHSIYQHNVEYHYAFETIRIMLEMTDEEVDKMYSPYFRSQKYGKNKYRRRHYQKSEKCKHKDYYKEDICYLIEDNPALTFAMCKEIYPIVKKTSFYKYKKEVLNNLEEKKGQLRDNP